MQRIPRRMRSDILVVSPEEFDTIDWSSVRQCALYMDIWGKLHLEIGHRGFINSLLNTSWWTMLVRQERIYPTLPDRMLRCSYALPYEDLMGVTQFLYTRGDKMLISCNTAILSRSDLTARGNVTRSPDLLAHRGEAFRRLMSAREAIARRLGARFELSTTSVISAEKMGRHGYLPVPIDTIGDWLRLRLLVGPLRNMRLYIKRLDFKPLDSPVSP